MLTLVSVRVSEEIKRRMKKLSHVNWSDYIRDAVERKIREEEMRRACETMDSLADKTSGMWSGSKEVRRWREKRYGRA
jgi:predicted DNA-binding protein